MALATTGEEGAAWGIGALVSMVTAAGHRWLVWIRIMDRSISAVTASAGLGK